MMPLGLGVPLAIISFIGFLLNAYIVIVVILTKQVSANSILLLHLGFVQSLLCIIFLVFSLPTIVKDDEWIGILAAPCILHGFLLTLLHPMTLWTICGLNCDRFYAIAAPLHYSAIVNTKRVLFGLGFGWIISIILCIPPFLRVAQYQYSSNFAACIPNFSTKNSLWYAILYVGTTFLLPAILIIGCNIRVLMIARYHRHRIASAIYEVTLSAQVTITHQRNPFYIPPPVPKFRSRSPVSTVLQLVGSFLLLYSPYYVTILSDSTTVALYNTNIYVDNRIFNTIQMIASIMLSASALINGILYGLKSKVMRKSFQHYWRKHKTKSEINHEIQARTPSTCGSRRPSVTTLGFLTRPMPQRRLSETLVDIDHNEQENGKPQMKRIASEIAWRPVSLTFASLDSPSMPTTTDKIVHTSSCNTLQVPRTDNEVASSVDQEFYKCLRDSFRSAMKNVNPRNLSATKQNNANRANFLLHKVFRFDHSDVLKKLSPSQPQQPLLPDTSPLKSPRILITRAFSEESEMTNSQTGTPKRDKIHRTYVSSTVLVERKWQSIKQQDGTPTDCINGSIEPFSLEDKSDTEESESRYLPDTITTTVTSNSNSSTVSEVSYKRYSSLEEHTNCGRDSELEANEEQHLLLSWPTTRKKYTKHRLLQNSYGGANGKNQFKANPLYTDRCEEPEIIL